MRIAMMVRGYLPVPRPVDLIYAPIDLAVAIAEGLRSRGHEVDFFAPLGSHVKDVDVESLHLRALAHNEQQFRALVTDPNLEGHVMPTLWDQYMATEMFTRARRGEYDLLHFHHPEAAMPYARENQDVRVAYTLHDPIYPWYKEVFELYQTPNQHFISISNNQRRDAPDLPYCDTVYNGVDLDEFAFSDEAEDYLIIAGRIVPEKGFKEAVQLAKHTGERLLIIGPVYPDMQGYFEQYIKPHLNDKILYLGAMEQTQLVRYYQKAKALIAPIQWEEPFGLTMIEAMACGTPVIGLHRGSIPEIVQHGKTGYIVHSMAEMGEAIAKLDRIKRSDCRALVQEKFSHEKMVDGYEAAFESMLRGPKPPRQRKKLAPRDFVRTQLNRVPLLTRKNRTSTHDKDKKDGRGGQGQLFLQF